LAPPLAIDVISRLLTYDPKERLTAKALYQHPFFRALIQPGAPDPMEGHPIGLFDFEFEEYSLNKPIIKQFLIDEIILSNSKQAREAYGAFRKQFPRGIIEHRYTASKK